MVEHLQILIFYKSDPDGFDQSQTWQAPEIQLDDDRTLVFEYS